MEVTKIFYFVAEFRDTEIAIIDEVLEILRKYSDANEHNENFPEKLVFPELTIIPVQCKVEVNDIAISLTHYEFDILLFLTRRPRQVFTKKQIYEAVWNDIPFRVDAKVECMIYSIRKKLREYTDREYIRTVWGVGYTFDPET